MQDVDQETDPVEAADDDRDLYGISTWERRSLLDSASVSIYRLAVRTGQVLLILLALLIFLSIGGLSVLREPLIGVLAILSALPALALAGYVWYSDVTERVIESVTYEAAGCGKCVQHQRNPARRSFGRRLLECGGYRDSTAVRTP